MYIVALIVLAVAVMVIIKKSVDYRNGAYYQVTKNSFLPVYYDKGRLGEYMTYRYLKNYEKSGAKFLFNIYIPKGENETTEIDVLMIHPQGLFVFESKNYSGWIFGSEYQKNWYQTLPQGRGRSSKETFYNPIMQNRTHIRHLKALVGEDIPAHSIITFSERCTLKRVEVKSPDIQVINRYDVQETVAEICTQNQDTTLSGQQIQALYDQLYPYSQVDAAAKARHIENIEKALQPEPEKPVEHPEEHRPEPEKVLRINCPRCGGTMILRTAKKGANAGNQFYGCSNYPKCRYVQAVPTAQNEAEGQRPSLQ